MANILGSLIVNVEANTGKFMSGMSAAGKAAKTAGKDIESSFSRLGSIAASALAPFGDFGNRLQAVLGDVGQVAGNTMTKFQGLGMGIGTLATVGGGAVVAAGALGAGLFELATHAAEVGSRIFEASEKTGLAAG